MVVIVLGVVLGVVVGGLMLVPVLAYFRRYVRVIDCANVLKQLEFLSGQWSAIMSLPNFYASVMLANSPSVCFKQWRSDGDRGTCHKGGTLRCQHFFGLSFNVQIRYKKVQKITLPLIFF